MCFQYICLNMKTKFQLAFLFIFFLITSLYCGCSKDVPATAYKTQNVVIVVVDGARYSETWGEPSHQFIPHRSSLLSQGVLCSKFCNNGNTSTTPGHTAMCTGVYQNINNAGAEYPANPSIFQYWLKTFKRPNSEAQIITTKDKLEVLSDCTAPEWKGKFRPLTDCGINGLGTGYREDSTTYQNAKKRFNTTHIRLSIINFKQPDAAGHAGDSLAYLQGILDTDNYIYKLWQQLQSDKFYKNRTTLIVTNDHGRHTAGYLDGYVSHGDNCDGCKHVEFFAIGPDFKQNFICNTPHQQIDIANTVAELMGFSIPTSNGKVMCELFSKN